MGRKTIVDRGEGGDVRDDGCMTGVEAFDRGQECLIIDIGCAPRSPMDIAARR